MRLTLVALTGFLAGSAMAAAVALIPLTTSAAARPAAAPSNQMSATAMANGMTMSPAARPTTASAQTVSLTILHVQRGCHVWSNGKTTGAMMRLHLKRGQTLSIMDMDVDAHKMMQFSGPMHMQMGGPMMTTHGMKMTFTKKGIYRFGTKTVAMAGMTDVKTIGPDNKLRLVVTVA
jgi:hypothetical protein